MLAGFISQKDTISDTDERYAASVLAILCTMCILREEEAVMIAEEVAEPANTGGFPQVDTTDKPP